jgi:ferredoxin-NADP reductase
MINLIDSALRSPLARIMTWPHSPESYIEHLSPHFASRTVKATVKAVQQQTPRAVSLVLQPNHRWAGYTAGQYVTLTVSINGRRHSRCFTISHTEEGCPVVTIQQHEGGIVSKWANETVWRGDEVEITSVQGDFILPKKRPQRFVMMAGGSGITPIRALTDALVAEDFLGEVDILYYVPTKADAIFYEHFQTLMALSGNFRLHLITTREESSNAALQGYFSAEHLERIGVDIENSAAYVCGPAALVEAVQQHWENKNHQEKLSVEYFKSAVRADVSAGEAQPIYFSDSDVTSQATGKTILEIAEGAGLEPMYGCRQGICRTCTCRKTSGQVKNLRTGIISDAGEEDIAICISVPVTPITIEL